MSVIHDPIGIFALLLAACLIAAWISDALRINLAAILLALGIIAGPDVAGLAESGVVLQVLGSIGVIYVFFYAGLGVRSAPETRRLSELKPPSMKSAALRLAAWVLLPAIAGVAVGIGIGTSPLAAVSIGFLFASAGVGSSLRENTAKFAEQESYGLPRSASMITIFGLLIVSAIYQGAGARIGILSCAFGCILSAAMLALFPRIASLVLRRVKKPESVERWFLLFLVFGTSFGGTYLFVPEWFTAFIAGVALSRAMSAPPSHGSRRTAFLEDYFGPAAFFFMGVSLQLSILFTDFGGVERLVAIVAGGFASRALAAFLSKRITLKKQPMLGLALPFTAFSLAIAWLFYRDGLFDAPLFLGALALSATSGPLSKMLMTKSSSAAAELASGSSRTAQFSIPNRILVALSKPASVPHLLDLASLLHGANNQSPLFPLVVRSPEERETIEMATSENILATAVMRLSDLKKPVLPINIEAVNPGSGILEAALQKKSDTIIIGWNKPPRLSHAFFGNVIDQVVSENSDLVLVARSLFPWKSTKQIFALFPPSAEAHEGFPAALQCVTRLAQASYAPLTCIAQRNSELTVRPIGQKTLTFASWREIPEMLAPLAGGHTSIALVSARPGEQSWNPAFERLPHILAESLPDANVVMIYMPAPSKSASIEPQGGEVGPEREAESAREAAGIAHNIERDLPEAILLESVRSGRIRVNMQSSAVVEAVYELVFSALPNGERRELRALADRCIDVLQKQPIEIEPGVVLLHDRLDAIQYPMVCFGAHRKGYRLSALDDPVHIIVLILVPTHQGPEDHLRFLADIASLFRTKDLKNRLLTANQPEDLVS